MSLLKKALQLAKLSNCQIYMKIFNPEDFSLLELNTQESSSNLNFSKISHESLIPGIHGSSRVRYSKQGKLPFDRENRGPNYKTRPPESKISA
jgi:hypothetical protein